MIAQFIDHEWHFLTGCATWLILVNHLAGWVFRGSLTDDVRAARQRRRLKAERARHAAKTPGAFPDVR